MTIHTLAGTGAETPLDALVVPAATAVTIPVPPPVKGGWRGTLFSTLALSLEVLLAMFRALTGWVARLVMHGSSRAGASPALDRPGFVSRMTALGARGFRFGLFLLILLVLGGLATLLAIILLGGAIHNS